MNMKKTMAALAAGAVAVSAMATTVSAETTTLAARTLTYNLVKEAKKTTYTITVKSEFVDVPLVDGQKAAFKILNAGEADTTIKIYGSYRDANLPVVQTTASTVNKTLDYNASLPVVIDTPTQDGTVTLDVVASNAGNATNMLWGGSGATEAVPGTPAAAASAGTATVTGDITAATISLGTNEANVPAGFVKGDKTVVLTYVATGGGAWNDEQGNDWKAAVSVTGTPAADDTITFAYTAAKAEVPDTPASDGTPVHANITVQVTYKDVAQGKSIYLTRGWETTVNANEHINAGLLGASTLTVSTGGVTDFTVNGAITLVEEPQANDKIIGYPYMSTLNNTAADGLAFNSGTGAFGPTTNTGDVLQHVWADSENKGNERDDQVDPAAIRAVINDCISKHDEVTFIFNTAKSGVVTGDGNRYADGDWEGNWTYTSFGRHYWDATPGYDFDATTYITNDWLGNNLFSGALVINNNLTLSLGEAQKFDWTQTSLSFSWDAIQDAALTKNQYANYIQNMVLRTSTTWFWDNFQVVLGETEVEEVTEGAPIEGNVDDLPEDEPEDFEDEPEDEPEEEEEEEEESEAEVAPAVANNPSTGNAPVALAVIPVALAAAAVVAKKRG